MTVATLLVFASALFVAAASPGPGVAAVVARVLGRGTGGIVGFVLGIAIGDVVWLAAAVFGLAAVAQSFGQVFLAIKYAGAAYLLYLAWKLWTAPTVAPGEADDLVPATGASRGLFTTGVALTLGNPKPMVFYLALLPGLIDIESVGVRGFLVLAVLVLAVLGLVLGGYVVAAARARRLLRSPRAVRVANRASGVLMAGAAAVIVAR